MVEYRRGIEARTWQELWHFNEQCPEHPTRGFAIADYPPFHGDVCRECISLTRDKRHDPQQKLSEIQSEIPLDSRLERVGRLFQDGRRKRGIPTD